jgi:hypothetical protein
VAGEFDSRGPPLRVEAPVPLLSQRGRVVLHLDVERSVVTPLGRPTVLLPSLSIRY